MNRPKFSNKFYSPQTNSSASTVVNSPYPVTSSAKLTSPHPSITEKYSLPLFSDSWPLIGMHEPDDYLHNPDPRRDRLNDRGANIFTKRGFANLGCLSLIAFGCLMLFAGYPILTFLTKKKPNNQGGFNLGGINATGQVPNIPGNFGLIDRDTPDSVYTKVSYQTGEEMVLVFSDEFETDGRTFYPGDDPYWEGVDLHYWGTGDLEWYDPAQATTEGGALRITLDRVDNIADNHNMRYKSGMIQTWNKFCFTGGLIEASIRLPGSSDVSGHWPAVWTMGNLGRAGFGASVEGLWPYSYDSCDVGTLPNQTYPGTQTPIAALQGGDPAYDGELSYLPGQRLSSCTCPGESHPGPMRADGSYVGRAAPEIDIIEATVERGVGKVSLSAQWAPFNAGYKWPNTSSNTIFYEPEITQLNSYAGGAFQQTTSGLAITNQNCYELSGGCFSLYGFEYKPGFDDAYITWVNDGKRAWTLFSGGMGPDSLVEIDQRLIPREPMYIIANLGLSHNFGDIDFDNMVLPATMSVDYIRVYQPADAVNVGCDPPEFPTAKYIDTYKEVYTNFNLTVWEDFKQPWPKNRLDGGC